MNSKTHSEQLADYILKNLKKGYTMDSLRYSLIKQGYTRISIENAIDFANKRLAEEVPPIKEKPEITYRLLSESNKPIKTINLSLDNRKSFWKRLFG